MHELRFYSFVAGLYLSPIQCGIQTAHAVAEMSLSMVDEDVYLEWAQTHKTIVICNALTSGGVLRAYETLQGFRDILNIPSVLFREDDESLGGAPTAVGCIVSSQLFDVVRSEDLQSWVHETSDRPWPLVYEYEPGTDQHAFVTWLKSFRLV